MTKGIKTLVIGTLSLFAVLLWAGPSLAESKVVVKALSVSPEQVVIAKGEEVIWVNTTGWVIHLEFETQPGGHLFDVAKDEAFRVRFEEPGEHKYFVHTSVPGGPGGPRAGKKDPSALRGAVVVK